MSGCWPEPLVRIGAGGASDLSTQGGADRSAMSTFTPMQPCLDEGAYVVGTTVQFGGAVGQRYEPSCLTARVGDTVAFSGSLDEHPLSASSRSTAPSPIVTSASGSGVAFRFDVAGYFPYYCSRHGSNNGGGMAGVIRVLP